MAVKKSYNVGDNVWIYGISPKSNKITKGKVIKILDLSDNGYYSGPHYIIEISTHIEPLLEIRTWENMSQDAHGPIGSFRSIGELSSTIKYAGSLGFAFDEDFDDIDGPTADEIMAALEKSHTDTMHSSLDIKNSKSKSRGKYFPRKKKTSE